METELKAMQEQLVSASERLPIRRDWTFKPMFGGVCGYVEGRILASLSNIGLALKLAPATQENLLMLEGAKRLRYEPDAPESKQYIVLPESLCADEEALAVWLERSVDYVLSLPAPKPKRAAQKAIEK